MKELMMNPVKAALLPAFVVMSLGCSVPPAGISLDEVHVLSVHRFELIPNPAANSKLLSSQGEGLSEEPTMVSVCRGKATQQTLDVLEEAVLRGPRVVWLHLIPFAGHGGSRGFSGMTMEWIRCRFSNGQDIDLRVLPGGKYFVQGESGFQLGLSEEAVQLLADATAWEVCLEEEEPGLQIAANEWIGRHISLEDISLDKSPFLRSEWEIWKIVSADLYSLCACPCTEKESNHLCQIGLMGQAKPGTIARIEEAIRQPREITLESYQDGRRELPPWLQESPSVRIACTLDNDQVALIEYFATSDSWCVKGEEGFRLPRRSRGNLSLLITDAAWE